MRSLIGLVVVVLVLMLLFFAISRGAEAGSYTVTTSAKEDTILTAEVTRINQRRGTSLTVQDWVQESVDDSLRPLKQADRDREARQACQAFAALSQVAQDAIVAQLGGQIPVLTA